MRREPAIDRLLRRCIDVDGCWVYQGNRNRGGYATVWEGRTMRLAHRLAWEWFFGPIPDGLTFDHLCRVRACVNPWHGDLVPIRINSLRAPRNIITINASRTHCPQGHEYAGYNLVMDHGRRRCRICSRETKRASEMRIRAARQQATA